MPQAILRPSVIGFYNAWALTAGATKVLAVDTGSPIVDDDNTSYLTGTAGTFDHQSFTLTAAPAGVLLINSVSLRQRSQVSAGVGGPAQTVAFLRYSGTDANINAITAVGTWTTAGPTAAAVPGGGSWTAAKLTTLEMGVFLSPGAGGANGLCTSLSVTLDYGTAAGGFVFLMSLLGSIGAGLTIAQMPAVNAALRRMGYALKPQEYGSALAAWRAYRHPAFA